jgi:hypothetical protein
MIRIELGLIIFLFLIGLWQLRKIARILLLTTMEDEHRAKIIKKMFQPEIEKIKKIAQKL